MRPAAEQALVDAQFDLGVSYSSSEGVPKDYVTAHMRLNLAAARLREEPRETRL